MLRFFKKSSKSTPLGRWGAIVSDNLKNEFTREKSIDFNSNWSNHDHCGAESCQIIIQNKDEKKQIIKQQQTKLKKQQKTKQIIKKHLK